VSIMRCTACPIFLCHIPDLHTWLCLFLPYYSSNSLWLAGRIEGCTIRTLQPKTVGGLYDLGWADAASWPFLWLAILLLTSRRRYDLMTQAFRLFWEYNAKHTPNVALCSKNAVHIIVCSSGFTSYRFASSNGDLAAGNSPESSNQARCSADRLMRCLGVLLFGRADHMTLCTIQASCCWLT